MNPPASEFGTVATNRWLSKFGLVQPTRSCAARKIWVIVESAPVLRASVHADEPSRDARKAKKVCRLGHPSQANLNVPEGMPAWPAKD